VKKQSARDLAGNRAPVGFRQLPKRDQAHLSRGLKLRAVLNRVSPQSGLSIIQRSSGPKAALPSRSRSNRSGGAESACPLCEECRRRELGFAVSLPYFPDGSMLDDATDIPAACPCTPVGPAKCKQTFTTARIPSPVRYNSTSVPKGFIVGGPCRRHLLAAQARRSQQSRTPDTPSRRPAL